MRKTYALNEKFFSDWSSEMAYVLGYIYADGYVGRDEAKIRIASHDLDMLEKIKDVMGYGGPILNGSNQNGTWYELNIRRLALYHDLRGLGVFPNKSLTMRFPDVPSHYLPDFIRGYFDGDGCIYEVPRKRPTPGMEVDFATGSKDFAESLLNILQTEVHTSFKLYHKRKNYYNIRGWNQASEALYTYMYNGNIHMTRKFEKFNEILNKRHFN